MSEGIAYADIVIIALIAGFILLRLRGILGQKTGHENPQFFTKEKQKPLENKDKIVQLQDKAIKIKPKTSEDLYVEKMDNITAAQALRDIRIKDPEFEANRFLEGAKMAFEMVFDAYIKGDEDTLRMLLADKIYNDFSEEMKKHKAEENKTETTLVAVLSKEISNATFFGSTARITVKFTSEQVTVLRNSAGEIVGGDASETEHVENEWVFERDVTNKNPNWKIIET